MTKKAQACCSSPAAICYWLAVSVIAWGALSLIGIYWRPLRASSAATCLLAMAVGCLANWVRNRTYHCAVTGPIFLIAGVVFLALRCAHYSRQRAVGLAICSHRGRHRVCAGMAVCETHCDLPLRRRESFPGILWDEDLAHPVCRG